MMKEFEDYHYLPSLLKIHCKNFEALTAFGTGGEINLANAFVCELPDAIHLRCKIHLSENIERKLTNLSFAKDARQNILNTIFGRRKGDSRTKALVDACSAEEFAMLEALETVARVRSHPAFWRTPVQLMVQAPHCIGDERQCDHSCP